MTVIDEIQAAVRGLANGTSTSVVGIGHRWAVGSGVVVGPGKVLTNAHNLRGENATVTFADGRTTEGRAVGVDLDGDIAVLDVDTQDAPAIEWGAPDGIEIGTPVFALANPGGRGLRVTFGLVSGTSRSFRGPRGRRISGSIEHTAPLLPGSSGGPTVDSDGRLLGINTNRLGEGFYLAIPATAALKKRIDALARGSAPSRPRLGVGLAPNHVAKGLRRAVGLPEVDGLLVRVVEEGGPADNAGIQHGDLLTEADGRALTGADDLFEVLEALDSGAILELKVLRGTDERTVSVTLS